MDLWVAAALAGAGYLSTRLKNVSRDKDSLSEFSSVDSNFQNPESPRCPLRRLAQKRKKPSKDVSLARGQASDGKFVPIPPRHRASVVARASSEDPQVLANNVDCNALSESSMPLEFSTSGYDTDNRDGNTVRADASDCLTNSLLDHSAREVVIYNFTKTRSSLKCKHLPDHYGKPPNSIERCLLAHLYKEHTKMEEYVLSSHPFPSIPLNSLLVTDGSQVISRARNTYRSTRFNSERKLHKGAHSESSDTVSGVPLLPDIRSLKFSEDIKPETRKEQGLKLNNSTNQTLDDGMLPFCLGICIGIVSSVMTNRKEVDKMKELLKQTENFVQDLREELDMKDLMTVKELTTEKFESPDNYDLPFDEGVKNGQKDESSDSMSRIEAELEAELERLGLHVDASSAQRSLSDHVEIDPDMIVDFAEGELRADMVGSRQADLDGRSGTSECANYAVCPRELSLRLYEVIEARLEERVEELEAALQNSERKLMESDPWRDRDSKQTESGIQLEPLVLNISGEALDAYNEVYGELMKTGRSEEDCSPSEEAVSRVEEYNDGGLSGDGESDYDEESERLLIKQIVEKTKKGSPVLLNAQMLLFSMSPTDN